VIQKLHPAAAWRGEEDTRRMKGYASGRLLTLLAVALVLSGASLGVRLWANAGCSGPMQPPPGRVGSVVAETTLADPQGKEVLLSEVLRSAPATAFVMAEAPIVSSEPLSGEAYACLRVLTEAQPPLQVVLLLPGSPPATGPALRREGNYRTLYDASARLRRTFSQLFDSAGGGGTAR